MNDKKQQRKVTRKLDKKQDRKPKKYHFASKKSLLFIEITLQLLKQSTATDKNKVLIGYSLLLTNYKIPKHKAYKYIRELTTYYTLKQFRFDPTLAYAYYSDTLFNIQTQTYQRTSHQQLADLTGLPISYFENKGGIHLESSHRAIKANRSRYLKRHLNAQQYTYLRLLPIEMFLALDTDLKVSNDKLSKLQTIQRFIQTIKQMMQRAYTKMCTVFISRIKRTLTLPERFSLSLYLNLVAKLYIYGCNRST